MDIHIQGDKDALEFFLYNKILDCTTEDELTANFQKVLRDSKQNCHKTESPDFIIPLGAKHIWGIELTQVELTRDSKTKGARSQVRHSEIRKAVKQHQQCPERDEIEIKAGVIPQSITKIIQDDINANLFVNIEFISNEVRRLVKSHSNTSNDSKKYFLSQGKIPLFVLIVEIPYNEIFYRCCGERPFGELCGYVAQTALEEIETKGCFDTIALYIHPDQHSSGSSLLVLTQNDALKVYLQKFGDDLNKGTI